MTVLFILGAFFGLIACLSARFVTRGCASRHLVTQKIVLLSCTILTALAAYAIYARWLLGRERIIALLALSFAEFHSLTDFENGYIYDSGVILSLAVAALLRLPFDGFDGAFDLIKGAAAGAIPLASISIFKPGWMGRGDVLLMSGLGALMGWEAALLALYFAFIIGGIIAFCLLLSGRANRYTSLPFAPFILFGTASALLIRWEVLERVRIFISMI